MSQRKSCQWRWPLQQTGWRQNESKCQLFEDEWHPLLLWAEERQTFPDKSFCFRFQTMMMMICDKRCFSCNRKRDSREKTQTELALQRNIALHITSYRNLTALNARSIAAVLTVAWLIGSRLLPDLIFLVNIPFWQLANRKSIYSRSKLAWKLLLRPL